jgi:hypothetical protein
MSIIRQNITESIIIFPFLPVDTDDGLGVLERILGLIDFIK